MLMNSFCRRKLTDYLTDDTYSAVLVVVTAEEQRFFR